MICTVTEQNKYHFVLDNIITWSNIFNVSLPTVYLVLFYLNWYNQWLFMDSKFYAGVMWILIKSHFLNSLLFDISWCLKPLSTICHLKSWHYWWRKPENPKENHRSVASHWQTLSHNVSCTPCTDQDSNSQHQWW